MSLPSASGELCFQPSVFLSPSFSVDQFVSGCRQHVSVGQLRDELLSYYQSLKSAMVELINKDYADFVELSSNLVGMDNQIAALTTPLTHLLNEITATKQTMDKVVTALRTNLTHRQALRARKASLNKITTILGSVERLHNMMDTTSGEMDRIAMEFNKLQYSASSLHHIPLLQQLQPQLVSITERFQHLLEAWFVSSLETRNRVELQHCLETYSLVSRQQAAEQLFLNTIIAPYMTQVVSTRSLISHSDGLSGVYREVLKVIPLHCAFVLDVCSLSSASGFDFLVNSVWPAIVTALERNIPQIFAPGNPDKFYRNYSSSMEFIAEFEQCCSSVQQLRAHHTYSAFISRWGLPVYFQIRYQEIAGKIEAMLSSSGSLGAASDGYCLILFNELSSCLKQCWSEGVFLRQLAHRFWKLTLQLLLRVSVWLRDALDSKDQKLDVVECVAIVHDVEHFTRKEVQSLFTEMIIDLLPSTVNSISLKEGLDEACDSLISLVSVCGDRIVDQVSTQCCQALESAHTIPRLYRRTNREVPTKPSRYVSAILSPLPLLECRDIDTLHWKQLIITHVTNRYYDITTEVLTSVKRTEDSLQKFKRSRRSLPVESQSSSGLMSDDNKIRLQLACDIEQYLDLQVNHHLAAGNEGDALTSLHKLREVGNTARATAVTTVT